MVDVAKKVEIGKFCIKRTHLSYVHRNIREDFKKKKKSLPLLVQ